MKAPRSSLDVFGHLGPLRRYARSLTGNDTDAEDLVHDALLRAYERRAGFRSGGNLRGWLMSILHNTFIDRVRAARAERRGVEAAAEVAEASIPAPQEHAARLGKVRDHFFALPEEQRAAIHLVAIEGLSYQDAADALGIPVGTLMSRIGRGRAALREMEDDPSANPGHLRLVGGKS